VKEVFNLAGANAELVINDSVLFILFLKLIYVILILIKKTLYDAKQFKLCFYAS